MIVDLLGQIRIIKTYKLAMNKKVNFINNKLFVGSQPDIFIGKVILGNSEFTRKNSTHDFSKILNHFLVFFQLLFGTIFSKVLIATSEPYLKSDTLILLQIIDDSESSDAVIKLVVSTHKPNNQTLPKIVQFVLCELEISLEITTSFMFLIFPFWLDSFLKDKKGIDLFRFFHWIRTFEETRISRIENSTKVSIRSVFPKLDKLVKVREFDNGLKVDLIIFKTHGLSVSFSISIVDDPFLTKGEAL